MKRQRNILNIIAVIPLLVAVVLVVRLHSLAASCVFAFSGANVNVGDEFNITLTWSTGDSDLGAFNGKVVYDTSMLELVDGDEYPAEYFESEGNKSASYGYTFKALKAGTTSVTVDIDAVCNPSAEEMSYVSNAGTITITAPTEPPTTQAPTQPPTEPPTTQAPTQPPTEPPTEPPTTQAPTQPPTQPPTQAPTEPPTERPTEPPTTAAPTTEAPTTTAEELSNNAYLEALSIYPGKMTPTFDRNKLIYEATVSDEVTKLSVSATTEHPDATYIISETKLESGKIVYDIKVTAQDGKTVLWYAIRVTKEKEATTTQAPTTAAPTTAEPTTAEPTTEEPTTPADPLEVVIGSMTGRVQETLKDVKAPEGYEEKTYNYNGVEIKALKGLANGLVLIPVSDGQSVNLYLYNEANGGLYPYVGIQITSALYTVLPFDEDEQMPNGYKRTFVEFGGRVVDAWIREDAPSNNYVVFYAMNWQGNSALYRYDAEENTLQRVSKAEIAVPTTPEPTEPSTEKPENTTGSNTGNQGGAEVDSQRLAYYEEQIEKLNRRGTVMFVIMVVLLLCLIAMYLLFTSARKDGSDDHDDDDPDGDGDTPEADEDFDDDDYDLEAYDPDDFDDLEVEELESADMPDAEEAEQLEKELKDIQLGMAGIVAAFEAETEDAEMEESDSEQSVDIQQSEAEEPEMEASGMENFEMDDLELEDLELEDLELEDIDLDDDSEK